MPGGMPGGFPGGGFPGGFPGGQGGQPPKSGGKGPTVDDVDWEAWNFSNKYV